MLSIKRIITALSQVSALILCIGTCLVLFADKKKDQLDGAAQYIQNRVNASLQLVLGADDDNRAPANNSAPVVAAKLPTLVAPVEMVSPPPTSPFTSQPADNNVDGPSAPRQVRIEEYLSADELKQQLDEDLDINKVPLEFSNQAVNAHDILSDQFNLVTDDFRIPDSMKKRVAFWFDIYSKYSSHFVLIHDADRPWIVYKVVDLRPIYSGSANRFAKDAMDRHAVANARREVKRILLSLADMKSYKRLDGEKLRIYSALREIPGKNRRKVILHAARNIHEQRGQKDFFRQGLIVSSRYLPQMEEIFAQYDLPVELVRLPLVESSFNIEAQSRVGASGIWQFMRGTGRKFLRVGNLVDERNSPIKATEAAAKLMLSNFKILHSWPLAVTAYNHGAGGLLRAEHKLHTSDLPDIINKFHSRNFSFASQNYYGEFLAALYAEKYQQDIFGNLAKCPPLEAESIDLVARMQVRKLLDVVGITMEELRLYNPDLKTRFVGAATYLPAGYHVQLPMGRKARLELYYQQVADAHRLAQAPDSRAHRG